MKTSGNHSLWIVHRLGRSCDIRLLLCPYAGGGLSAVARWTQILASITSNIELWIANLPGRGARIDEPGYLRMLPLVRDLMGFLENVGGPPVALFGHSVGALIAYEAAREMTERGFPPVHLFVSGCPAPHLIKAPRKLCRLPAPKLIDNLRTMRGTPREILDSPDFSDMFLPAIRSDFEIFESYEPRRRRPICCPVSAYCGRTDSRVHFRQLKNWQSTTSDTFRCRQFAGNHFYSVSGWRAVFQDLVLQVDAWRTSE